MARGKTMKRRSSSKAGKSRKSSLSRLIKQMKLRTMKFLRMNRRGGGSYNNNNDDEEE